MRSCALNSSAFFFLSAFAAPSILNIWIRHRDVTHADGYACVEPGAKYHKDG